MTKRLPELGDYSEAETSQLAVHALNELSLDARIKAVLEAFDDEEREELATRLDEVEGEDPKTA